MSLPPSDAFKAWHAKRAAEILKNADALATEYIKDGFSNSGSTRQIALFKAMELVDETGWDAWRDSREQALEEASQVCRLLADCEENTTDYRNGAAWCAEQIRRLI